MSNNIYLVLEDGSVFSGQSFGADTTAYGEVVFNTSMAGYQEMLTDPSYAGQILVLTYPLIGNYGTNSQDNESAQVHARGLVCHEYCKIPSNCACKATLDEYLEKNNVPAIYGIDTRELTKKLRQKGVMMGVLTNQMSPEQALTALKQQPSYDEINFLDEVACKQQECFTAETEKYRLALVDCGVKRNIIHILNSLGASVTVYPHNASAQEILSSEPDGVFLSPGPGDPAKLDYLTATVKEIINNKTPLMGICLGHQMIGRAFGLKTFKLKFGHRGGNHPVQDTDSKKVYISAQNHGYAVTADNLPSGLEVSFINLNDNTIEGLRHTTLPIMSIQYHAEGSPGPMDSKYLFERFLQMIDQYKKH
ncbi:MAG: glutamine-hydrolyzing carbamoyl-phosphate synthase small subunit [Chloroflexi bacterium]|nr:glutamine-hydrolyzing carbamoyl-phosphate synthase small subunit [Chloroflexota bacterium]